VVAICGGEADNIVIILINNDVLRDVAWPVTKTVFETAVLAYGWQRTSNIAAVTRVL